MSVNIKITFWLLISCALISCHTSNLSKDNRQSKTKILVLGDVQLKSNIHYYNNIHWDQQVVDTTTFSKVLNSVLNKESPDFIFQTGDWVNYNNNLHPEVRDSLSNTSNLLSLPYDEWKLMNQIIPEHYFDKFYMAVGNHESYKKVVLQGVEEPNSDAPTDAKIIQFDMENIEGKRQQLEMQFPHLKKLPFHRNTGSYVLAEDQFDLISFDGLDKDRSSLLAFLRNHLEAIRKRKTKKKLIVMSHYPIFTGRDMEDDNGLVLRDIRDTLIPLFDQYKVDLYINGHEHFYLRYKNTGLMQTKFSEPFPLHTKYITISNFVNPYPRELKRIESDKVDPSLVFFNGVHYSTITIKDGKALFTTFGLEDIQSEKWQLIDSFTF